MVSFWFWMSSLLTKVTQSHFRLLFFGTLHLTRRLQIVVFVLNYATVVIKLSSSYVVQYRCLVFKCVWKLASYPFMLKIGLMRNNSPVQ